MEYRLNVEYTETEDGLRLQGMHYAPEKKEVGVVFIHGMSGNFIENAYANIMGVTLAQEGIGFIYGHNRGYGHINDIPQDKPDSNGDWNTIRQGAWYERFSQAPLDIESWMNKARKLGYSKLIVIGHSLGCPKLVYWWNRKLKGDDIAGVILMSPADMIGLTARELSAQEYQELIAEANSLVNQGNPTALLSKTLDHGWFYISAQTFLEEMAPHSPADVLPLNQPDDTFDEYRNIDVPMLIVFGDHQEVDIHSVTEDLQLLKNKALDPHKVETKIIDGANHNYENREEELAKVMLQWIKSL